MQSFLAAHGIYAIVLLGFVEAACFPIPSEVTFGFGGVLVAQAPAESLEVEALIDESLVAARDAGIGGQAVTPFVLAQLHERSGGATVGVNKRLIADNAALAAELAVTYSR